MSDHHWHIVYDRLGKGAQPVGTVDHAHRGAHWGHTDEEGHRLPWGKPHAEEPMHATLERHGLVQADDPEAGTIWVPPHRRHEPL